MAIQITERNGSIMLRGNVNAVTSEFISNHMRSIRCKKFIVVQENNQTIDTREIHQLEQLGFSSCFL